MARTILAALLFASVAAAQTYYNYIGNVASDSVLLAWGTADGVNTIGRSSPSRGEATIRVAGRTITSRQNWVVIADLKPDSQYPYEIELAGKVIGRGTVRTWPETATRMVFFAIGDWGNGSPGQYAIGRAMWNEFQRRASSNDPVRFIMSLGDNIYGDISTFLFGYKHTGDQDVDWAGKFFEPYKPLLAQVPFYPVLGNHDGNETESRGDLAAYLDNFFFPGDKPARYYNFRFANLAEFFALDTTSNTESGPRRAQYFENGPQSEWLRQTISASTLPWKIPYLHHPVFNAGPRHVANYRNLEHWVKLFQTVGVKVAFTGHEHNLQFSEQNERSAGIRWVVSGAGGELRSGDARRRMRAENIAGWAPQRHFLVVEIEGKTMRITPMGAERINVRNPDGGTIPMPVTVTIP
jgi:tartrate-resistant acid phosphatase type 5